MIRLHVNIDHVATVRQARRGHEPDPVAWALAAEAAGADGITCHLRKDRRHIQDADVVELRRRIGTVLNLELSLDPDMVTIGLESDADLFCLVPENRQELTTEGGLDVVAERARLLEVVPALAGRGGVVSLFVDPDPRQVEALAAIAHLGAETGARLTGFEINTAAYARAAGETRRRELERVAKAARRGGELGFHVYAGHGLTTANVGAIAAVPEVEELNIGHYLVARAVIVGMAEAVREMLAAMRRG